jgi:hypothetical protein
LRWRSRLKISFCEIFGVVPFSTFATDPTTGQRSRSLPKSPIGDVLLSALDNRLGHLMGDRAMASTGIPHRRR